MGASITAAQQPRERARCSQRRNNPPRSSAPSEAGHRVATRPFCMCSFLSRCCHMHRLPSHLNSYPIPFTHPIQIPPSQVRCSASIIRCSRPASATASERFRTTCPVRGARAASKEKQRRQAAAAAAEGWAAAPASVGARRRGPAIKPCRHGRHARRPLSAEQVVLALRHGAPAVGHVWIPNSGGSVRAARGRGAWRFGDGAPRARARERRDCCR
mmetsp:Transcript_11883/g.35075  ORF Transcript_11883/g.35075 Transcript_11883/m.35075 type:complete len:215 (-) Transcript_11883:1163-1807(-)